MASTSIQEDRGFRGLFPIGTLIHSRYEILDEGKSGGMGMIYKCRDTRHGLHREVALKIMQPKLLASQEAVDRFRREAAVSRDLLHHPNIVRVFHDDEWQDASGTVWYYILMEWIEGRSLRELLEERRRAGKAFTVWEAYRIISQLAAALSYGHNQKEKILHRDVKPENILVFDETTLSLKLGDFGIAKIVEPGEQTRVDTLIAMSPYMSPELREGRPDVDQRTDVYSTGVILYELLTLDNTAGPYCPSEINREVSKGIDGIYKKAVAPRPEQRYQDMSALSEDLLMEARREGIRAQAGRRRAAPFPPGENREVGGRRSRAVLIALAALAILAGAMAAFYGLKYRGDEKNRPETPVARVEQEPAEKESRGSGEKASQEPQGGEEEATKAKQEQEKTQTAVEGKAKEPAAKTAAPKAPAKEDMTAKMKRWQRQMNLSSLPEPKPAMKPDRTGTTVIEDPRQAVEPERRASQEGRPKTVEETKMAAPQGTTADFYYRKGLQFVKNRHFLQASGDFSRAIEIDPGHEMSYYWRGVAQYRLNNYSKALSDFTAAIRIDQNDLYYHWRGVTYFRLNNYHMAVNDFTQAINIRPNNVDYRWRAACFHRLGRPAEADADYTMAARLGFDKPMRDGAQ